MPIAVALDGRPFEDTEESLDDFYSRVRDGAVATTSQPSPAEFAAAYERAAARGAESVISIHLDHRVSGTVASAEIAARDASVPVKVVDTGTVSFGVAVCVRTAAAVLEEGGSARDAARHAARAGRFTHNAFVARAGPGGRVPVTSDWAVLHFTSGATSVISKRESVADAVVWLARHARLLAAGRIKAAVGYAGREMQAAADELSQKLVAAASVTSVERYRVGAAVGAHTGAESFGAFWWPATRAERR